MNYSPPTYSAPPLKISLITETFPPEINGVAMTLGRIVEGLCLRGNAVTVAAPKRPERSADPHQGARLLSLPGMPIPRYPDLRLGFPARGRFLRQWRAERPDIVHVATEGPLGWSAARTARSLCIPLVTSFHTNFHRYGAHYGYGVFQKSVLFWLRHVHGKGMRTFVPSEDLLQTLKQNNFTNLRILSRGIDTVRYSPAKRDATLRREWGVHDSTPIAIYVGRVASEKNLPLTLQAWQRMRAVFPRMPLVVVGDGPERAKMEREHPDVRFVGMKTGEDLARHYASADVFPFASSTETFGNVVTEAMASGLVVIAYDYAAPARFIRDGANGYLAPLEDADSFLSAATRAAAAHTRWPALRDTAREAVLPQSWDTVVEDYEAELHRVINQSLPQ